MYALQIIVFLLVSASFTNIYITQPVLPVLQDEFAVDEVTASYSVAAVILGIALSNLPFGAMVDRFRIRSLVIFATFPIVIAGLLAAYTENIWVLIAARFIQGLFIPALTTCVAAFLAKTQPPQSLNVLMGSYVSATVIGGLGGRLLGGWIHPPLHWRYAFVSAAVFLIIAVIATLRYLPTEPASQLGHLRPTNYRVLLKNKPLVSIYLASASSFFVFSSVFNYLPFRLEAPPFSLETEWITMLYVTYLTGVFLGPLAGHVSNKIGNGFTMMAGALILAMSVLLTLSADVWWIVIALIGICAGFFTLHASAVGAINHLASDAKGRANALYVFFYYLGGGAGITLSGIVYSGYDWQGFVWLSIITLLIPMFIGWRLSQPIKQSFN